MAMTPLQLNHSPTFLSSVSPPGASNQLPSLSLPQSVEALIAKICRDQRIDPPDEAALLRLHRLGEEVAMDILRKIERSTVRKSFSALLMFLIKQHECSQNGAREDFTFHPELTPSNQPINTGVSIAELPPTAPTTPQSVCSPTNRTSERHGTVNRRLQFTELGTPNASNIRPSFDLLGPLYQNQTNASNIRPSFDLLGPLYQNQTNASNASPQMLALGELEFRKAFMILSYLGRNKLEEKVTVEFIKSLKYMPMGPFEISIFNKLGGDHISRTDRIKDFQWDTSKTHVYKCHIDLNGNATFKGPFLEPDQTHLQRVLGDDNILQVSFDEEKGKELNNFIKFSYYSDAYQRFCRDGIMLGLRRYRFLVYKDGGKERRKKNISSSSSSSVKCYFVRTDSEWAMDQHNDNFLLGASVKDIRLAFMHIHKVESFAKFMPRLSLILSETVKLNVDLSNVNVKSIDDIHCMDGSVTLKTVHTDGTGFISEDLALQCPLHVYKGKDQTRAIGLDAMEGSSSWKRQKYCHYNDAPPLLMQVRLFWNGLAAKGTLLVNRKLPLNTIHIRDSMIKVKSEDSDSSIQIQPFNSLEIVNTSSRSKRVYLSKMLISLLHYGGVPSEFFLGLLSGALLEIENCFCDRSAAANFAKSHSGMDEDDLLLRMLCSKIPLDEPYLKHRLAIMIGEENKGLQEGRIPISDTYYLMGTSDPTGTLRPNQVCIILDEGQLCGEVLVYKHPGLHPGDIHRLQATYVPNLEEFVGNAKYGIFFPTVGARSLADEMANSDYDGDMYWVSRNPELLKTFTPSAPWAAPEEDESKTDAKQNIPSDNDVLEGLLFKEFLKTRFEPSPAIGIAAECWLTYMDRLLTHNSLEENERKAIYTKMEQLVDISYDALDAWKSGKKVQVPRHLLVDRYPHFLEKKKRDPYHSTSILGQIYDTVQSFKSEKLKQTEINPLPLFMEDIPKPCIDKWNDLYYKEYLPEMGKASNSDNGNSSDGLSPEIKDAKSKNCRIVIDKYKEILYGEAKDFNSSKRPHWDIYNEARAIYQIVYKKAVEEVKASYLSFAWRVAGEALCDLFLRDQVGNVKCSLVDWEFMCEMRR